MISYNNYRDELKNGDILAWTPQPFRSFSDIIPYIVKYGTGSDYYHVGQVWRVGDRIFVVEAVPPLVRIYPLSRKPSFWHLPMNVKWTPEKENGLLAPVGDDYSLLKAALTVIKKPSVDNTWQCALKVGHWFEQFENKTITTLYTPSDVVNTVLKETGRMIYVTK